MASVTQITADYLAATKPTEFRLRDVLENITKEDGSRPTPANINTAFSILREKGVIQIVGTEKVENNLGSKRHIYGFVKPLETPLSQNFRGPAVEKVVKPSTSVAVLTTRITKLAGIVEKAVNGIRAISADIKALPYDISSVSTADVIKELAARIKG